MLLDIINIAASCNYGEYQSNNIDNHHKYLLLQLPATGLIFIVNSEWHMYWVYV